MAVWHQHAPRRFLCGRGFRGVHRQVHPGGGLAPTEVGVMSKKESSRHPCFCPPHQGSCTEAPSGFKS